MIVRDMLNYKQDFDWPSKSKQNSKGHVAMKTLIKLSVFLELEDFQLQYLLRLFIKHLHLCVVFPYFVIFVLVVFLKSPCQLPFLVAYCKYCLCYLSFLSGKIFSAISSQVVYKAFAFMCFFPLFCHNICPCCFS